MLTDMAKLVRSDSQTVICEAEPIFSSDPELFSIGLSDQQSQVTYHMHLTPEEARQWVAYILANDKVLPEVEMRPD
jgi:hypothetical protein